MGNCKTCKYFSKLIWEPSEIGECCYCQKDHCIYCKQKGKYCKDYEYGENDGGRYADEYSDEEAED